MTEKSNDLPVKGGHANVKQSTAESILPTIYVTTPEPRSLKAITGDALKAVRQANGQYPQLFNRGGVLARVVNEQPGVPAIKHLNHAGVKGVLARVADWMRGPKATFPPGEVVADFMALPEAIDAMPRLNRVLSSPAFDAEGRVHHGPGYVSELHAWIDGRVTFPPVPDKPTPEDVVKSRDLLNELVCGFPFTSESERTHAIGALLLPFVRDMIDGPTPIHLIESPVSGTGKGLLAKVLPIPALGVEAPAISEGKDEEEWRKRISSLLIEGPPIILLDNITHLGSSALAAAITTGMWKDRVLGSTRTFTIPVTNLWLATGNNPGLSNEISRRTVRIRLDAGVARPWLGRTFKLQLPKWANENRTALVHAALTVCRSWVVAERPEPTMDLLGGFESWSEVVGGILEHGGWVGFLENLFDFYSHADIESEHIEQFVSEWWSKFESQSVGVSDLFELALPYMDLGDGTERSKRIRLGEQLKRLRDRIFAGYRVELTGTYQRAAQWALIEPIKKNP